MLVCDLEQNRFPLFPYFNGLRCRRSPCGRSAPRPKFTTCISFAPWCVVGTFLIRNLFRKKTFLRLPNVSVYGAGVSIRRSKAWVRVFNLFNPAPDKVVLGLPQSSSPSDSLEYYFFFPFFKSPIKGFPILYSTAALVSVFHKFFTLKLFLLIFHPEPFRS